MADEAVAKAAMAAIDQLTERWAQRVGWREELDQLADASRAMAGKARLAGPGGASLEMLILRQRNLIDRWVRQAYAEGVLKGMDRG